MLSQDVVMVQSQLPQDVPLLDSDYFELGFNKTLGALREASAHLTTWKNLN